MSTHTLAFLSGRTLPEPSRGTARRSGRSHLQEAGHHLSRRRYHAARRAHERQDRTDAYLDRTGMTSFAWTDGLARHVGR
jgi:hypothetical protein